MCWKTTAQVQPEYQTKKEESRDGDERVIFFVIVSQKGITLIHDIDYLMRVLYEGETGIRTCEWCFHFNWVTSISKTFSLKLCFKPTIYDSMSKCQSRKKKAFLQLLNYKTDFLVQVQTQSW